MKRILKSIFKNIISVIIAVLIILVTGLLLEHIPESAKVKSNTIKIRFVN